MTMRDENTNGGGGGGGNGGITAVLGGPGGGTAGPGRLEAGLMDHGVEGVREHGEEELQAHDDFDDDDDDEDEEYEMADARGMLPRFAGDGQLLANGGDPSAMQADGSDGTRKRSASQDQKELGSESDGSKKKQARVGDDGSASKKKSSGPMECSVDGCTKKSRGSSGKCRSHGGGERCVVEGCAGFARLDGRCCMHGGAQMCNVAGCQRRARFFGRCTMHGGYVNCKEPGCGLRAVGKGKCAKHGGKDHCKHPGCSRPRLKSRDDWCHTHHTHIERLREEIIGHRMMGAPVVQCGYFEVATVEQCPETGVPRLGLCPEHYVYSLCGDGAHCQHRAQIRGKCVEHAHAVICRQQDCRRKVEEGTTSGFCKEHDHWRFPCVRHSCSNRALMEGGVCPQHDPHKSMDMIHAYHQPSDTRYKPTVPTTSRGRRLANKEVTPQVMLPPAAPYTMTWFGPPAEPTTAPLQLSGHLPHGSPQHQPSQGLQVMTSTGNITTSTGNGATPHGQQGIQCLLDAVNKREHTSQPQPTGLSIVGSVITSSTANRSSDDPTASRMAQHVMRGAYSTPAPMVPPPNYRQQSSYPHLAPNLYSNHGLPPPSVNGPLSGALSLGISGPTSYTTYMPGAPGGMPMGSYYSQPPPASVPSPYDFMPSPRQRALMGAQAHMQQQGGLMQGGGGGGGGQQGGQMPSPHDMGPQGGVGDMTHDRHMPKQEEMAAMGGGHGASHSGMPNMLGGGMRAHPSPSFVSYSS